MTQSRQDFPNVADLLKRLGIWLDKRKSQHFLKNQTVCAQIAELANLSRDHVALEVGAGLGNLTVELSARAGEVLSIELDSSFAEWHEYLAGAYPKINFIHRDFLDLDLDELLKERAPGKSVVGVGNLPYQITSEILFRFVLAERTFESLVFMVQKEVAERVAAGPATRASGALTYKIAMRYTAEIAMLIGPEEFLPPPKVDSAILILRPLASPLYTSDKERTQVYKVLDRIFNFRRKTLSNGLMQGGLAANREESEGYLATAGIDPKRRPETLELEEVMALSRAVCEGSEKCDGD